MVSIPFRRDLAFEYGRLETVAPGLRRLTARNPGPFTFHGTGVYVIGEGEVAVIDPGPALPEHEQTLIAALAGEIVSAILITHTHLDHSPAARALQAATGAPTYGFGPHGSGAGDGVKVEEGGDMAFTPDVTMRDGDVVSGGGAAPWTFEAVHTPGHTSNHLCFSWREAGALFSGDHVMGWSTSVVSPPDGDMAAYLASLEKLLDRDERIYWPTHGASIDNPKPFVSAFIRHRQARELQIAEQLDAGVTQVPAMVETMYAEVDRRLHPAAARSVLAHLIHMVETGRARTRGDVAPTLAAEFAPAR